MNGLKMAEKKKLKKKDKNCRLRKLIPDCLVQVFKHSDTDDLCTLSRMNVHYKNIIRYHILHKKQIVFNGDSKANHKVFKSLGKGIKNIRFDGPEDHILRFVNEIMKYCSKDNFKNVEFKCRKSIYLLPLWLNDFSCINLNDIREFFRQVQTATFSDFIDSNIVELLSESDALRSLKLESMYINGINWNTMLNLTQLHLIRAENIDVEHFLEFIRQRPQLKCFMNEESIREMDMIRIGEALAEYCGDHIRVFSSFSPMWENLSAISAEVLLARYDYLGEFTKLKELTLISRFEFAVDLLSPLAKLAKNNTLEKFKFVRHPSIRCPPDIHSLRKKNLNHFTSLKTIEIFTPFMKHSIQCTQMDCFIKNAAELMPNVENVFVRGTDLHPCFEFVKYIPNLRKLSIANLRMYRIKQQTLQVKTVLEQILKHRTYGIIGNGNNSITLEVNDDQWGEFKSFEYNDKHINVVTKKNVVDKSYMSMIISEMEYKLWQMMRQKGKGM